MFLKVLNFYFELVDHLHGVPSDQNTREMRLFIHQKLYNYKLFSNVFIGSEWKKTDPLDFYNLNKDYFERGGLRTTIYIAEGLIRKANEEKLYVDDLKNKYEKLKQKTKAAEEKNGFSLADFYWEIEHCVCELDRFNQEIDNYVVGKTTAYEVYSTKLILEFMIRGWKRQGRYVKSYERKFLSVASRIRDTDENNKNEISEKFFQKAKNEAKDYINGDLHYFTLEPDAYYEEYDIDFIYTRETLENLFFILREDFQQDVSVVEAMIKTRDSEVKASFEREIDKTVKLSPYSYLHHTYENQCYYPESYWWRHPSRVPKMKIPKPADD